MTHTVTRLFLTPLLTGLLGVGEAFPQASDEPASGSIRLGVSVGITSFALGDLRDLTDDIVSGYEASGLPVELEREYPPNLLVGVECTFIGLEPWAFGVSGSYTWTSAYALYADYAGTLELHSKVQVLAGYLVAQYSFAAGQTFQPFVDIRGGISWVFLAIKETVDATDYAGVMGTSDVSGDKLGVGGETTAGLRYAFGSLALTGRVGYRYSNVSEMDVSLSSSGQSQGSGTLGFDINSSGFLGVLTLEVTL